MLKNTATPQSVLYFKERNGKPSAEEIIRLLFNVTKESAKDILNAGFPIFEGLDLVKIIYPQMEPANTSSLKVEVQIGLTGREAVEIELGWSLNQVEKSQIEQVWKNAFNIVQEVI